jgi:hypothetical protein
MEMEWNGRIANGAKAQEAACLTTIILSDIWPVLVTNTRTFLRSFTTFKSKARKGETVRIQDKEGEYLFTAATPKRKSLVGAATGKIIFHDDLTKPTLSNDSWKPSL